ncbi:MAG: HlyC/CorC family transporter [Thermoleophilia bacterium]|nr:HlyC/CorC family transporter [Thermoleophilia bacterium]
MNTTALQIVGVILLVLVNAFFVLAEFAIVKVRDTRMAELAAVGSRRARVANHIVNHLDAYLSATQLGVTVASMGLGWLGAEAFRTVFGYTGMPSWVAAVIAFVFVTFLTIIFGELVPKSVAIRKAERSSLLVALPLRWFYLVTRPITWLMYISAAGILKLFHITPASERELAHSEEELRMIIEASQEVGHIDEVEQTLMRRALTFGGQSVGDIMVPRTEMTALSTSLTVAQAIEDVAETNHTRYPAYEEDVDNIVGYIHVKDLYRAPRDATLRRLLRPIGFIAETSNIEVALQRFQSTRTPLTIVVDEHGGTAGIVTIQDVVEELIGEVQDEFDLEAPLLEERADGSYSVDGGARVDLLEEALGLSVLEEGFPTLGGRVFEQLQRRPQVGDEVLVGNFHARVLEVDGMRICRVLLTRVDLQSDEEAELEDAEGSEPGGDERED